MDKKLSSKDMILVGAATICFGAIAIAPSIPIVLIATGATLAGFPLLIDKVLK